MEDKQPEDNLSRDKRRAETWGAFLTDFNKLLVAGALIIAIIVGIYAVMALHRYNSNEDDRQKNIWEPLKDAVANFKDITENAKNATSLAPGAIGATTEELGALKRLTDGLTASQGQITGSVDARLQRLDGVIEEFRATVVEGRRQIAQNGDAVHASVLSLNDLIKHQDVAIEGVLRDGSTLISTSSSRIAKLLDDADGVVVGEQGKDNGLQGVIHKFNVLTTDVDGVAVEAKGAAAGLNRMTNDAADYEHKLFFPDPPKGFWGKTWHYLKGTGTLLLDTAKFYYTVKPVAPVVKLPTR